MFRRRHGRLEMDLVPEEGLIRKEEESEKIAGLNNQMYGNTNC